MEIFKQLPLELKYYIMYECNGIQHPIATLIKEFVIDNNLFKTEQFKEPNFYEYLKLCKILKENIKTIRIIEYDSEGEEVGWLEYPLGYAYGIDSDSDYDDHVA